MTVQQRIVCACGNPKTEVKGILICGHCDRPCPRASSICSFCRTLTKVTR